MTIAFIDHRDTLGALSDGDIAHEAVKIIFQKGHLKNSHVANSHVYFSTRKRSLQTRGENNRAREK